MNPFSLCGLFFTFGSVTLAHLQLSSNFSKGMSSIQESLCLQGYLHILYLPCIVSVYFRRNPYVMSEFKGAFG